MKKVIFNWKTVKYILYLSVVLFAFCGGVKGYKSYKGENESITSGTFVMPENVTRAKPVGEITGIYARLNGVLVLEDAQLHCDNNKIMSPCKGKLQEGDYIIECNKQKITSKEELQDIISDSQGNMITLLVLREGKKVKVSVYPVKHNNEYKIGVWVRDDLAGLGTITIVLENGSFAALGHCMSDIDIGREVSICCGSLHKCHITDIRKGKKQKPGAVMGYIDYKPKNPIGSIEKNSSCGILGQLHKIPEEIEKEKYYPLASPEEIENGDAELISNVSGKRKSYKVKIKKLNWMTKTESKDFEIQIVDEELIKITGGIVQGMSGSPIIQNGKIVGALTHVLVKEPTRGYGIFIQGMLR